MKKVVKQLCGGIWELCVVCSMPDCKSKASNGDFSQCFRRLDGTGPLHVNTVWSRSLMAAKTADQI